MRIRILSVLTAVLAVLSALWLAPISSAAAATASGGVPLTSGKPVHGVVSTGTGVSYTFTAVAGRHVTLAITRPDVSPTGNRLQMNVFDSSGATDASGELFSTGPTEIDFTPTADQAGRTTVVISPYDSGTTGSFTLTYATDVTGVLKSGVAVHGTLKYAGQQTAYTFTAVAGRHVTFAISRPEVSPGGNRLLMNVVDSSGATDASGVLFSTGPTEIDFTPTADQAGKTTVVISDYDFETTGSFTLTYATDVTGALKSGVPVRGTLKYAGQQADYTFTAVAGRPVSLAISKPEVSPAGNRLLMNVVDSSGALDASGVLFSTGPNEIDFTPTADQAGKTTVVISDYDFETTGSFTLTYTAG
jgi:large repetitive protein